MAANAASAIEASVDARTIARRFEGGTASLDDRLDALGTLARAGYPVGLSIAANVPLPQWRKEYDELLRAVAERTDTLEKLDLSVELITHRFTPGSKDVLLGRRDASAMHLQFRFVGGGRA